MKDGQKSKKRPTGYDKDQYIDPAILSKVRGGSYAYCDADGNYYRSGFGLHY